MGTNYYAAGHQNDPEYHIGKRSAAGYYCWDCRQTLCMDGEANVNSCRSRWYDRCPKCGKSCERESLSESALGLEMGLNEFPPGGKAGVRSCSSFRWARALNDIQEIVDEYGTILTRDEFLKMVEECPIHHNSYGREFI